MPKKIDKGFTLIELLVVISIIALLASIVLAATNTALLRARIGAGEQFEDEVYHTEGNMLAASWNFDEGSTFTTVSDSSGNGYTGTLVGGPTWITNTPTGQGWALTFNGINQYVSTNYSGITGTGARTISVWVKTTTTTPSGNGNTIVGYGGNSCPGFFKLMTNDKYGGGTNYNGVSIDVCGGAITYSAPNLYDGQWHNIVAVMSAGATVGQVIVYLDGTLIAGVVHSSTPSQAVNTDVANKVEIGGYAGSTDTFSGSIDNVRIYAKDFTAMDVGKLYAVGKTELLAEK